jgi:hypothetical protein
VKCTSNWIFAALDPAKFRESVLKRRPEIPHLRIIFILEGDQHPDPPRSSKSALAAMTAINTSS